MKGRGGVNLVKKKKNLKKKKKNCIELKRIKLEGKRRNSQKIKYGDETVVEVCIRR